jgi:hypothetical protein
MTLLQQARTWWHGDRAAARRLPPPRKRFQLGFEQLEDRTTPSILGAPVPFVSLQSFSPGANGQLTANWAVTVPGAATQTVSTPVSLANLGRMHGCQVLNLNLGPVHLDVLGLVVNLQPVTIDVRAFRGPGQLLGNLLCGPPLHGTRLLNTLAGELNTLLQVGDRLAALATPANPLGSGIPLNVQSLSSTLTGAGIQPGTASCPVLTLNTGAINLDVLGLDVSVPTGVHLTVTAVPSSQPGGGILGDLLCQLSNALNNPSAVAGKLSGLDLGNILGGLVGGLLGTTTPALAGPINLSGLTRAALNGLGTNRGRAAGSTQLLNLTLGPINLNLLGLQLTTSAICLKVSAQRGPGNLLGNLLSAPGVSLRNLLNGLGGLLGSLLNAPNVAGGTTGTGPLGNTAILQGLLNQLASGLSSTTNPTAGTSVLHLVLGPLNLDLLGLIVHLDNCANGPVTVDLTAIPGPGNLLGNLLGDLGNLVNGTP